MHRDAAELTALVKGLARHPELWQDVVVPDPAERQFGLIARTDSIEVWAVAWLHGHDTGFHDHDASVAAIAVVEGEIVDERMAVGGSAIARHHGPGAAFTVDAGEIHRVRHAGATAAVTLHAYSPPLQRMGSYAVADDGRLLRTPVGGDEALSSSA